MATRTQRKTVVFGFPFLLKDIGRTLPAGGYEVLTDEELIGCRFRFIDAFRP
jgi:hypothetical protein